MDSQQQSHQELTEPNITGAMVLRVSTLVSLTMIVLALAAGLLSETSLVEKLYIPSYFEWGKFLFASLLCSGIINIAGYFFQGWYLGFRRFVDATAMLMGPLPFWAALYLSVLSACSEELFFRGALQPLLGLGLTSGLFAFLHTLQEGPFSARGFWIFLAGLLLGWLYQQTDNLWAPILAHSLTNLGNVWLLKKRWVFLSSLDRSGSAASSRLGGR